MNMDSFMMSGFQIIKGEGSKGGGKRRHHHETKGKLSSRRSQIVGLSGNQKIMMV